MSKAFNVQRLRFDLTTLRLLLATAELGSITRAAEAMATVAEGLDIDEAAIARNLAAAGLGDDIGDSSLLTERLVTR